MTRSETLVDGFGRRITYLRLSVTDRCDLRCSYCMAEDARFEPKANVLTLEELEEVAAAFIARGVRKVRLTGGEPLVRRNVMQLVRGLSKHLGAGLDELTLTTNATQLSAHAAALKECGVRRINVSLDTLDPVVFAAIARRDALEKTLEGVDAALAAGLKVKINTVALKDRNLHEIPSLIEWAHGRGMDLTLIEVMPMGEVEEDRTDQYAPLSDVRTSLARRWTLEPLEERTGGPARYVRVRETGGKIGFITPLTNNFCDGCNRVRVTCTGQLYMCLGQQDRADLRAVLRAGGSAALSAALDEAMTRKPKGHDFSIRRRGEAPATPRFMSATGG
ncbi:MAG: GTP 3',8-cyclase MoaA [Pseudomonadota bacterium]|nr:GTP 3',8-cyclase MoaA [Pseudomonadota bacterium]